MRNIDAAAFFLYHCGLWKCTRIPCARIILQQFCYDVSCTLDQLVEACDVPATTVAACGCFITAMNFEPGIALALAWLLLPVLDWLEARWQLSLSERAGMGQQHGPFDAASDSTASSLLPFVHRDIAAYNEAALSSFHVACRRCVRVISLMLCCRMLRRCCEPEVQG